MKKGLRKILVEVVRFEIPTEVVTKSFVFSDLSAKLHEFIFQKIEFFTGGSLFGNWNTSSG